MKPIKHILFLIKFILFSNFLLSQNNQLSLQQKRTDFLYLHSILKENYPFFGVKLRTSNINWLEQKDYYLEQLEKTENDSSYIVTLQRILKDLNDGHLNLSPTRYGGEGYRSAYYKMSKSYPRFNTWLHVFDENMSSIEYWASILRKREQSLLKDQLLNEKQSEYSETPNYTDTILISDNIAIMTIKSFNYHMEEEDRVKIDQFLKKIAGSKALIIDIQENGGGSETYWIKNIVQRLIKDSIQYIQYPIIKDGQLNRFFYSTFFYNAEPLEEGVYFSGLPSELIKERYFIRRTINTIYPKDPVKFDGKIFLLVSPKVFSASEAFAQFCKSTKWAIIAGEQTGGDGIGKDPALIVLPESKIVIGYPSLVGLNNDGSINAEERTKPDIVLTEKTYKKRLNELIQLIKKN